MQTNVFVAKYVSFQLKLDLLYRLAAIVDDVNIDVEAGSANPDLSMEPCSNPNNFDSGVAGFDPFVGGSQGAWQRHESLLSCIIVSCAIQKTDNGHTYGHRQKEP